MHMPRSEEPFALSPTHPIGGQLIANLRDRIVRGELPPGSRLSEQDIANHYGMSRQPVREAFIRLAEDGLVEVRPQRGTFVRKISTEEVEASRFVREAVEVEIVRLAVSAATGALVADLHDQVERQTEVSDDDALGFMRLDERFHRTLAEAAGRAGAWAHLQPIKRHMDRVRYLTAAEFPLGRLVAEHRAIADALAARDAQAADAAIRRHLRGVLEDLPLIVAAQPDFFETGPGSPGRSKWSRGRTS